jgi:hypothetical protein
MFMNAQTLAIKLVLALAFSFLFFGILIQSVESQTFETIHIRADGSIEGTDKIQWQGNVYTLTSDIAGTIEVEKSDIVIDGAGYTLQGRGVVVDERGIYLTGLGWGHPGCGNVSVRNFRISNFQEGIYVVGGRNNSLIGNYLENAQIHLIGNANLTGDLIKHNTIKDAGIFVDYNPGGIDVITENNFIDCGIYVGLSVAPIVDRNYWSDYTTKCPDAKELDGSGIWDTPYVDDRYEEAISCIDYHPLTQSVAIPAFPDPKTPTAEPSPTSSIPEFSTSQILPLLIAIIVIVTILLVTTLLLKRNKHSKNALL